MTTTKTRLVTACLGWALVACGGAAQGASGGAAAPGGGPAAFPVVMQRTPRPGQRVHMTARSMTEKRTTLTAIAGGAVLRSENEHRATTFAGTMTIAEVDPTGDVLTADYVVEELARDDGTGARVVVPPGQTLRITTAASRAQATFSLSGGQAVTEAMRDAIADVLETTRHPETDDQIFGTATPQPIGASWPVQSDAMARGLSGPELTISASSIQGASRLSGAPDFAGVACLDIATEVHVSGFELPGLPPGSHVDSSTMTFSAQGIFPRDPTVLLPTEQTSVTFDVTVTLVAGAQPARLVISSTQQKTTTRQAVPPG